jgi:hypothetical protein
MQEIPDAGSSILMVDYRGYGKSAGHPTENGLYLDADAAYDYLRNRGYGPDQIIVHGESLCTAVAVDLASRRECAAVVLEAAFTSGGDVAGSVLPWIGQLLFRGFDSKRKIAQIRAPILFLHGDRDDIIPARLGRALFDAAPQPKTFAEIAGAGHNNLLETAGRDYGEKLREFYAAL